MRTTAAEAARIALQALTVCMLGAIAVRLALPADAPPAADALRSVHRWWYMGRASGFVAYALLLASMLLGIGISSRVFDGVLVRPWVFEMHQFFSIFVLVAMAFHALILLPDPYAHFSLAELLVPFASPYRPLAVALGVIALYGSAAVTMSYYAKQWLGQKGWRTLHYVSFVLFAFALVHGATAGADASETWVQVSYLVSGLAVVFFTFFRILAARSRPAPK
jgi:sulfoxide reductase heme-binding subunit YedZ